MAFEALNNAGARDADLLVILNDNDMSISEPVGALNHYLARADVGPVLRNVRRGGKEVLSAAAAGAGNSPSASRSTPRAWSCRPRCSRSSASTTSARSTATTSTRWSRRSQNIKQLKGPQFLHVVTRKGQGYKLAEADPIVYHGVTRFDPGDRHRSRKPRGKPTYTQVFGDWLCDMADARPAARRHHAGDARRLGPGAVLEGAIPDRYFDVGIAEQHAVTFAAGLACEGMKPVVAIYSTFLQRG